MIPKIIHYCWYGNPIENNWLAMKCLSTWKTLDCKVKKWDESTCSFTENEYVCNAYENLKYAHLSDFYRLLKLYEHGGIYMDTDVHVSKKIPDWFYEQKLILCFQYDDALTTAFIMAEKHSPIIRRLLELYDEKETNFNIPNNSLLTEFVRNEFPNFLFNGKTQCLGDGVWVFPKTYFDSPSITNRGGVLQTHVYGIMEEQRTFESTEHNFKNTFVCPILGLDVPICQ